MTLPGGFNQSFVGRARERAFLANALRKAGNGTPTVAIVTGEEGVGKTALLTEMRSAPEATDFVHRVASVDSSMTVADLVAALALDADYALHPRRIVGLTIDEDTLIFLDDVHLASSDVRRWIREVVFGVDDGRVAVA